jgi:hypothetical protein
MLIIRYESAKVNTGYAGKALQVKGVDVLDTIETEILHFVQNDNRRVKGVDVLDTIETDR